MACKSQCLLEDPEILSFMLFGFPTMIDWLIDFFTAYQTLVGHLMPKRKYSWCDVVGESCR